MGSRTSPEQIVLRHYQLDTSSHENEVYVSVPLFDPDAYIEEVVRLGRNGGCALLIRDRQKPGQTGMLHQASLVLIRARPVRDMIVLPDGTGKRLGSFISEHPSGGQEVVRWHIFAFQKPQSFP